MFAVVGVDALPNNRAADAPSLLPLLLLLGAFPSPSLDDPLTPTNNRSTNCCCYAMMIG
jgi:hypothetical protein